MIPNSTSHARPACWSDHETRALVASYRDRWLSTNRGMLRASDWGAIASQISSLSEKPLKTAVQCQQKVEKLRRRYREEKKKLLKNPNTFSSSWEFFPLLDSLVIGSFGSHPCSSNVPPLEKKKLAVLENKIGKSSLGKEEAGSLAGVGRAIMVWGENFVRVEEMKMEVAKEIERMRMEMELERDEMMLEMEVKLLNSMAYSLAEREREGKKRKGEDCNGISKWGKR